MTAARIIRASVAAVEGLRQASAGAPRLHAALLSVKQYQSLRFHHSYRDILAGGPFQLAGQFFLDELYGAYDFSRRDAQFARIAGAIERLLPAAAVATAVALARLHVQTERLDCAMAKAWMSIRRTATPGERYVIAWKRVGERAQRQQQLQTVLELGRELERLTRIPALRRVLKMMRLPAAAAGLSDLQHFLETGFDAFASMATETTNASDFLGLILARETQLIDTLFAEDARVARAIEQGLLPPGDAAGTGATACARETAVRSKE